MADTLIQAVNDGNFDAEVLTASNAQPSCRFLGGMVPPVSHVGAHRRGNRTD